MDPAALRDAIEHELRSNLAPFWRERVPDPDGHGFIAAMDADGTVRRDAPHGLVLAARLLWTYSALYRRLGEARDLVLARRAAQVLAERFADREHGGWWWSVGVDGRPLVRTKRVYGQAFCIYALAEHHRACGDAGALAAARRAFELVERHSRDPLAGGYLEARAADWSETDDLRLGEHDLAAPKSMNTHLHLLEAYSALHAAAPDATVAARVRELLEILERRVLARAGADAGHLRHFFAADWRPLGEGYTYGHDIETVWLAAEAAHLLTDERLVAHVRSWTVPLARAVLAEGIDRDGALAYAGCGGTVTEGARDWWCQAEAVVGMWDAWEATGDARFAAAAAGVWRFVERAVVDREGGEWHWRVRADGSVDRTLPKVSEWKCPYHGVRMCLEMLRRLGGRREGSR